MVVTLSAEEPGDSHCRLNFLYSWTSISWLSWLHLLALWHGTQHKRSLDVQPVPLSLLVFIIGLTVIIILCITGVGRGVEGGRGRGGHRVGPGVTEAVSLWRQMTPSYCKFHHIHHSTFFFTSMKSTLKRLRALSNFQLDPMSSEWSYSISFFSSLSPFLSPFFSFFITYILPVFFYLFFLLIHLFNSWPWLT